MWVLRFLTVGSALVCRNAFSLPLTGASRSFLFCSLFCRFCLFFAYGFRSGVAMVFSGIGLEMRGKYQRNKAKQIKG